MPEIRFTFRDFFHPLGIVRLAAELRRNERASEAALEAYQMARLRRVLDVAYLEVPHYRDLFRARNLHPTDIRCPADLELLPILDKASVRALGDRLVAPRRRAGARRASTSGTTSEPLAIYLDGGSAALEFVYYWRQWGWAGYHLGARFAQLNTEEFAHRPGEALARFQPVLGRLLLDSSALSEANLSQMADALRRYRPRFLKGLASPLYFLALMFERRGGCPVKFEAVFSTGEMLLPSRRKVIERVFGCRAIDSYGMLEQAAAIAECPEGGLHVRSDYALVELRPLEHPPAGVSRSARYASLVGTTLHNLAMPLLRYETGDAVELAPPGARCPCGRTLPLVRAIHGRVEDAVVTPDGRYVTTLFLARELVEEAELAQFVQEDERTLAVRVVPGPAFGPAEREKLLHHTRKLVGPEMTLRFAIVAPSEIERGPTGKVPLVVSRLAVAHVPEEEVP